MSYSEQRYSGEQKSGTRSCFATRYARFARILAWLSQSSVPQGDNKVAPAAVLVRNAQ